MAADGSNGAAAPKGESVVVPHDPVNEIAVIAAAILSPEARAKVVRSTTSGDFASKEAQNARFVLGELYQKGLEFSREAVAAIQGDACAQFMYDVAQTATRAAVVRDFEWYLANLKLDAKRARVAQHALPKFLEALRDQRCDHKRLAQLASLIVDELAHGPSKQFGIVELALALATSPPIRRLLTGDKVLDATLGGGFRFGTVVGIVGSPDGGKTALGCAIARDAALAGHRVAYLASDGGDEDIVARNLQLAGLSRDAIDGRNQVAIEAVARRLALNVPGLRIYGETSTFEDVTSESPQVLIIDSVQTTHTLKSREAAAKGRPLEPRLHVEAVVEAAKLYARLSGALVIIISEANRAAYRSRKANENSAAMAAAAESRAVEFGCRTLLVLRGIKGKARTSTCEIAKGKDGGAGAILQMQVASDTSVSFSADESSDDDCETLVTDEEVIQAVQDGATSSNAVVLRLKKKRDEVLLRIRQLEALGILSRDKNKLRVEKEISK